MGQQKPREIGALEQAKTVLGLVETLIRETGAYLAKKGERTGTETAADAGEESALRTPQERGTDLALRVLDLALGVKNKVGDLLSLEKRLESPVEEAEHRQFSEIIEDLGLTREMLENKRVLYCGLKGELFKRLCEEKGITEQVKYVENVPREDMPHAPGQPDLVATRAFAGGIRSVTVPFKIDAPKGSFDFVLFHNAGFSPEPPPSHKIEVPPLPEGGYTVDQLNARNFTLDGNKTDAVRLALKEAMEALTSEGELRITPFDVDGGLVVDPKAFGSAVRQLNQEGVCDKGAFLPMKVKHFEDIPIHGTRVILRKPA